MAKAETKNDESLRGSEDAWLDAAYQLLLESGVNSVRIMTLAKKLKLSRTSFYWYFEDREALLQALIDRWKNKNTGNLIAQTRKYAGTISEAIFNLFDCWLDPELFDRKLDVAIRSWSAQSAELKAIVEQMDRERIEAIAAMFSRFGFSGQHAEIRASAVYYTQIGYTSLVVEEPIARRVMRMPDYVEIFAGVHPSDAEINRFLSRHEVAISASLNPQGIN